MCVRFHFSLFRDLPETPKELSAVTIPHPLGSYALSSEGEHTGNCTHSRSSMVAAWSPVNFPDPVVNPQHLRLAIAKLAAFEGVCTRRLSKRILPYFSHPFSPFPFLGGTIRRTEWLMPTPRPSKTTTESSTRGPSSGATPKIKRPFQMSHIPKIAVESATSGLSSGVIPKMTRLFLILYTLKIAVESDSTKLWPYL